jgi:hypothetical protein
MYHSRGSLAIGDEHVARGRMAKEATCVDRMSRVNTHQFSFIRAFGICRSKLNGPIQENDTKILHTFHVI